MESGNGREVCALHFVGPSKPNVAMTAVPRFERSSQVRNVRVALRARGKEMEDGAIVRDVNWRRLPLPGPFIVLIFAGSFLRFPLAARYLAAWGYVIEARK